VSGEGRLRKQLGLFDVFVISAAAMFSSGFFLLPGVATTITGPSVVLAYVVAGLLMVPALVSQAELATAMPRAGGAYYFLDRTLGPLVGVISGFGTWLALMLKSAFALIGLGAYLGLVLDVPIRPIALGFAAAFGLLNVLGSRESTRLIRVLVFLLFGVLSLFIVHGIWSIADDGLGTATRRAFHPLFTGGLDGFLGTVGLVFISYVGLTKVASLAEEVRDPDRNIPLGMMLSLAAVTAIYALGVYIMVVVLGTDRLSRSLTPVADAALVFISWIPARWGEMIIVFGACAAFFSMANAGILAASRYPLAMARDRLMPDRFAHIGRFHTPVLSVVLSSAVIGLFIGVLNVSAVAKMASALQLLLFGFLNLAVIVMRESQIESYDPGFHSPLYPWMQILGIVVPFFLVAEMGFLPALFVVGVVALSIPWYVYYARDRIKRDGAIFHVFARLGRRRFAGLDRELRDIMKEKGARAGDPFDEVVARAVVLDLSDGATLSGLVDRASRAMAQRLPATPEQLTEWLMKGVNMGGTPVAHGVALLHCRLPGLDACELVLVREAGHLVVDAGEDRFVEQASATPVHAVFVLVSGDTNPGRHLRILAQLAGRIENPAFMREWLDGADEQDLKEVLLRDDRFLSLMVEADQPSGVLIGHALRELDMPEGCLVALIRRYGVTVVPRGRTVLREADRLTIIGEPNGLAELKRRYG